MQKLRKGQKTNYNGVLLTNKEYETYKKITNTIQTIIDKKKQQDTRYNQPYN